MVSWQGMYLCVIVKCWCLPIGLGALASSCPSLRWVDLSGCTCLTDAGVQTLARCCTGLEVISLMGCTALSDRAMQELGSNCHRLNTVSISDTLVREP